MNRIIAGISLVLSLTVFLAAGCIMADASRDGEQYSGSGGDAQIGRDFSYQESRLEQLIDARRALEKTRWDHRIWPDQNPGRKPPLSAFLSEQDLRRMSEDALLMSAALELYYDHRVSSRELQAELDRMARNTRAPGLLRELFAALDGDPEMMAESLARPVLAERLLRRAYARDARIHGELERRIKEEIATKTNMKEFGGRYTELELVREELVDTQAREGAKDQKRGGLYKMEQWEELIAELGRQFGIVSESGSPSGLLQRLPVGQTTGLIENDDSFVVRAILDRGEGRMKLAAVRWPKRAFTDWWSTARNETKDGVVRMLSVIDADAGEYSAPEIAADGCTDDSWTSMYYLPNPVFLHTAVWTGSEMIVWGGENKEGDIGLNRGGRYDPATDSWTPTSTSEGVPLGRDRHTAVWTGTEMIIWGGYSNGGGGYQNSGARYNPITDTWAPTSEGVNVPSPREHHTAVWTGSEMIIWGGYDWNDFNTGGRYDPFTDSWTPTSTGANVPSARYHHTAVWTGSEMIVWGGTPSGSGNTGARYNPTTDTWTPTSTAAGVPSERSEHTSVWTGTEMIVWGGCGDSTGGRYDPDTDSWTPTSTGTGVPEARSNHTAIWSGSEMIVWGGGTNEVIYGDGGRYDPASDTWTPTSTGDGLPSARRYHTAVWADNEMIVWGGKAWNGPKDTGGRYDPTLDSWEPTTSGGDDFPPARTNHTAVWTGAEMVIWGGNDTTYYLDSGGRYDPATDSWTPTSTGAGMPGARSSHTAVWSGTDVIIWGGTNGNALQSGGRYDPVLDSWTPTSTAAGVPAGRVYHTAIWSGDEMIVWGGENGTELQSGGRYDPATDSWTPTSTSSGVPAPRSFHTAVWTGTEMIIWGGSTYNTGARYAPLTDSWTPTSTGAGVPSARTYHTAVWTGSRMIVWGGIEWFPGINTGGVYDPSGDSWTPTSTGSNVPPPRYDHSAVWSGEQMVIWGGVDGGDEYEQTGGRYDPVTDSWTPTSVDAGVPAPRARHSVIWTGTEMIVWGGQPVSANGGRYCGVSCTPLTWWEDADSDTYGNPSVSESACEQPMGFVDNDLDCDDSDANTYPQADETNDGKDNQCSGDPGYGVADELSGDTGFHDPGDKSAYCWDPQDSATEYEVKRSDSPGMTSPCHGTTTTQTCWFDVAEPLPGNAYFYLTRSTSPFGGSWGYDSEKLERTSVCP